MIDSPHVEKVTVNLVTLDSFVKENHIRKLDFIKCDVEGGEFNVLKGAKATLKNLKPIVMMELLRKWSEKFGYHPNEVITLFASFEYSCFAIQKNKLHKILEIDEDTIETNFLFLHEVKHQSHISLFNKR